MQLVQPDVHTICMGLAASMRSFLLAEGEITKRKKKREIHCKIICNAQKIFVRLVMIHQPASSFYEAQTREFILEAEELLKLCESITMVYVQRMGKPLWVVSEDMERDVFISAT
ncbi:hypothetical protein GQ457_15G014090 [Hibiscus cannabinus]